MAGNSQLGLKTNLDKEITDSFKQNPIFKDENVLDFQYVPEELPCRRAQLSELSRACRPLLKSGLSNRIHLAVVGTPGVGKTVTIKYWAQRLVEFTHYRTSEILCVYYNGYATRTVPAIFRDISRRQFNIESRGYSAQELRYYLFKALKRTKRKLLIILDEADFYGFDQLLNLIHVNDSLDVGAPQISTILIGRTSGMQPLLDAELSNHITKQVRFPSYNADQLIEILTARAHLAFHPTALTESTLALVGQIVSARGSAGEALGLLREVGRFAEGSGASTVTPELVEAAYKKLCPSINPEILVGLKPHELLLTLAIATRLTHRGIVSTHTNEAYEYYTATCKKWAQHPRAKSTIHRYLRILKQREIISFITRSITRRRRGARGHIGLPNIPAHALKRLVEQELARLLSQSKAGTGNGRDLTKQGERSVGRDEK